MKRTGLFLVLTILLISCAEKKKAPVQLLEGSWLGSLQVSDTETLPFTFSISKSNDHYEMEVYNAEEVIFVDGITVEKDSIRIQMPVFEGYLLGTFSENRMEGQFIKESLGRVVPFSAEQGTFPRFKVRQAPAFNVSGVWETTFDVGSDDPYPAKGIFLQEDEKVTGTFRTKTGDFRYLEGVMDGDSLKISAFDGGHAFLFTAKATESTLTGSFYSGNHSLEAFEAKRNAGFELPDANSLTYLKEGYDEFSFSFPDATGNKVSLTDAQFNDKVVLVQIMGTWCPNCLDETRFYVDYLKKHPNTDLQFVGLAFEYAKTEEKAFAGIERLKKRVGVNYPILLAQYGSSDKQKANEKLPMLNHVLSYPTTIFIDKEKTVRKIHTGFNGPATGEKHLAFQQEFDSIVKKMLSE